MGHRYHLVWVWLLVPQSLVLKPQHTVFRWVMGGREAARPARLVGRSQDGSGTADVQTEGWMDGWRQTDRWMVLDKGADGWMDGDTDGNPPLLIGFLSNHKLALAKAKASCESRDVFGRLEFDRANHNLIKASCDPLGRFCGCDDSKTKAYGLRP